MEVPFYGVSILHCRQQQVEQTHPGSQAEQGDQVARVGAGALAPPLDLADVHPQFPGQTPPGQPRCFLEALQPPGKILGEAGRLQPVDPPLASHGPKPYPRP